MEGICQLYLKKSKLSKSHIHPKFASTYNKKTGSNYFRNLANPNKRFQDVETHYMLSVEAENEFSKREKWFSENIFKPYLEDNKKELNYDENLFYFTVSYLWRTLIVLLKNNELDNHWGLNIIKDAEKEWREFLSSYKYPKNYDKLYLQLTDRIEHHTIDSQYVDFYFTRVMDFTTVSNENQTFLGVYAKFNRFIFWGILKGGNDEQLAEIKINPISGRLDIPQQLQDQVILSFYLNRLKQMENSQKPSSLQKEKIEEEIYKDVEGFLNSDIYESMKSDNNNNR
jgi:hypothetical protein